MPGLGGGGTVGAVGPLKPFEFQQDQQGIQLPAVGNWVLGVSDIGDITSTFSPATNTSNFPILNDSSGNSWQLSAPLIVTPILNGGYPLSVTLISPSGFLYNLFVLTSGMLQTVRIPVLQMRDAIVY
jgi:hypothetical protein